MKGIMSTIYCKFNRPLLVRADTDRYNTEYKTIYGFALETKQFFDPYDFVDLTTYVGYLCIVHSITNGDGLCSYINIDGHDKIIDWEGQIHEVKDPWALSLGKELQEKLGLYYILTSDYDDEEFRIDEKSFMVKA